MSAKNMTTIVPVEACGISGGKMFSGSVAAKESGSIVALGGAR